MDAKDSSALEQVGVYKNRVFMFFRDGDELI